MRRDYLPATERRLNAWKTKRDRMRNRMPVYTIITVCLWGKGQGEDRPAGMRQQHRKNTPFHAFAWAAFPLPISVRVKSKANSDKEKPFVPE